MSFVAMKLVSMALLPSALLVELATAGPLLRRRRVGRVLLWLGVGGLAACLLLPVGYVSRDGHPALAPSLGGKLATLDLAAQEWEGLLAYWLAGKTSSLFPTSSKD